MTVLLLSNANAARLVAGERLAVEEYVNPAMVKFIWHNLNLEQLFGEQFYI